MAGDDDSIRSQDSTNLIPPPPSKNLRIETDTEAKAKEDSDSEEERKPPPSFFVFKGRVIRRVNWMNPEYVRQGDLFYKQFTESEGFDVDWDSQIKSNRFLQLLENIKMQE